MKSVFRAVLALTLLLSTVLVVPRRRWHRHHHHRVRGYQLRRGTGHADQFVIEAFDAAHQRVRRLDQRPTPTATTAPNLTHRPATSSRPPTRAQNDFVAEWCINAQNPRHCHGGTSRLSTWTGAWHRGGRITGTVTLPTGPHSTCASASSRSSTATCDQGQGPFGRLTGTYQQGMSPRARW